MITRSEEVNFKIEFNREQVDLHRDLIHNFLQYIPTLTNGDDLNLTYTIYIDYIGNIVKCLSALETLLDAGVIIKADHEELNYGRSLIISVLNKIDDVQRKS
jgi:hypothetical protein